MKFQKLHSGINWSISEQFEEGGGDFGIYIQDLNMFTYIRSGFHDLVMIGTHKCYNNLTFYSQSFAKHFKM